MSGRSAWRWALTLSATANVTVAAAVMFQEGALVF